jgi:hypothetical protein
MTNTDWLLDIVLMLIVLRQIREGRIDRRFVLLPLGIVAFIGHSYLSSIPTNGNDLVLVAVLMSVGAILGVSGGLATRVRSGGDYALAKAGWLAATLWVLGMGSRMAFQLWSDHGGEASIAHFSISHDITSNQAWVAAFVLMALTEVITRLATIVYRAYRVQHRGVRPALPVSTAGVTV